MMTKNDQTMVRTSKTAAMNATAQSLIARKSSWRIRQPPLVQTTRQWLPHREDIQSSSCACPHRAMTCLCCCISLGRLLHARQAFCQHLHPWLFNGVNWCNHRNELLHGGAGCNGRFLGSAVSNNLCTFCHHFSRNSHITFCLANDHPICTC